MSADAHEVIGKGPARPYSWTAGAASVIGASALTAVSFILLSHYHLTGRWPLWVPLSLLVVGGVAGELTSPLIKPDTRLVKLHFAIGTQCLATAAVIYAIGWGPTLAIGYLFIAARALTLGGSRTWQATFIWSSVSTLIGQILIGVGAVKSYVAAPYVHGLAGLSILGLGFVMSLLGEKTEESEVAIAARDLAASDARQALSLLTATLDSTADGILVVDMEGKIRRFNARFAQMWRIPGDIMDSGDDSAAIGFVLDQLLYPQLFIAKVEELYANPDAESDDTLRFKDGRVFDRHSRPQRVDGKVVGRVWSFRDVSDHYSLLDELEHQAFHDGLTGLANRSLLRDRLDHALARSRRSAATVAVLFCDLDGFKMINDTLGHDIGDLLLVEVAHRLTEHLREGDTAARFGGDEFTIVLDDTEANDAEALADRLLESLRQPFVIEGREIVARASIGIADSSDETADADSLLSRADIAMYAAKSSGRDRWVSFEPMMQSELASRHLLHSELRHAVLVDGSMTLHYQPVFDLKTRRLDSFEALVRWDHPTRGLVAPDEFIPMAEETGLIIEIGRYVLREACWQATQWHALPGDTGVSVSINVSSAQLYYEQFVPDVASALRDSGLPPTRLILELTESALLSDTSRVHSRLADLKNLGIRIAIDDFGTGYSSLSYLRKFPIDFLKVDRSFVNELHQPANDQARALVRSIVGLGHDLNLSVIAEGIEDPGQLQVLLAEGCDLGQGYLLGYPAPPDETMDTIHRQLTRSSNTEKVSPS